jgi:hypothetical protein
LFFLCGLDTKYSSQVFNNFISNSGFLLSFLYQQYCYNLETSQIFAQLIERYDFNDYKSLNEDLSVQSISQKISDFLSTIYQSILHIY